MRVRGFTQDDAHVFCKPDQLDEEICRIIDLALFFLGTFGFTEYEIFLSTRPEKYVGTLENWEKATMALEAALNKTGLPFTVDPAEGVFYGPKIDIKIKDALGRTWQCTTIQVDFNEPERFEIGYVDSDGREKRPIMIHRAIMGSLERFMGVLIEHYAGAFPAWLAPVQAILLPITSENVGYAAGIAARLVSAGIRATVDERPEKVNYKIREAQVKKVPYMAVVGKREQAAGTISLRVRGKGDVGEIAVEEFISRLLDEIGQRTSVPGVVPQKPLGEDG
jgi:threonyl-tRNA synthetase